MRTNEFMDAFRELIQTDMALDIDTQLEDLEEWDSMAIMALIAWLDVEHGVKSSFAELEKLKTVGDVASLVPGFEK